MAVTSATRAMAGLRAGAIVEAAGVAALAGTIAGVLVGGFGSRLAMRVAGSMTNPVLVGLSQTENGFTVGNITGVGTIFLILFAVPTGLAAGAAYGAARPWLVPFGRGAGLAFGLVLLGAVGPLVLEPFNLDFQRFGSPKLNVALFALLFPLFGIALGIAHPRVERAVRDARGASLWPVLAVVAAFGLALTVFFGAVSMAGTALSGGDVSAAGGGLLYFLVAPVVLRLALAPRPIEQAGALDDVRNLGRPLQVLSYAVLLAPAVLGAPAAVDAILFLSR
jgi:hypothetical protein